MPQPEQEPERQVASFWEEIRTVLDQADALLRGSRFQEAAELLEELEGRLVGAVPRSYAGTQEGRAQVRALLQRMDEVLSLCRQNQDRMRRELEAVRTQGRFVRDGGTAVGPAWLSARA